MLKTKIVKTPNSSFPTYFTILIPVRVEVLYNGVLLSISDFGSLTLAMIE